MGRLKRAKARVGPLLWQKAMSEDEKKKTEVGEKDKYKSDSKRNKKGFDTSFLGKASDSHLLVVALVPTVSFAATFTLPGRVQKLGRVRYDSADSVPKPYTRQAWNRLKLGITR